MHPCIVPINYVMPTSFEELEIEKKVCLLVYNDGEKVVKLRMVSLFLFENGGSIRKHFRLDLSTGSYFTMTGGNDANFSGK